MRDGEIGKSNTLVQYDHIYQKAQENSPCNGVENISIIVHQTKSKKRKKYKIIKCAQQTEFMSRLSRSSTRRNHRSSVTKHSSMPRLQNKEYKVQPQPKKSDSAVQTVSDPFQSNYVVNLMSEYPNQERLNPFYNPHIQPRLKVYRCQLTTTDDGCCCSCNSDAMFEVMKSLYDCYKKKNCDNCNCILCGHMPREERRLAEARKGAAEAGVGPETAKEMEKKKEILKKAEKAMEGKTIAEKEKIMRDLIKSRVPLPEPKTPSEKDLVKRLKTEYGLPSEPKSRSEKEKYKKAEAAGLITPLSGKTPSEKEKILKKQVEMGIPLPEGRTPSEKALIEKVKATTKAPSTKIPSEKWRKAKAEGLLTPIEGKPPEQKEKILRGLAMQGLPLPEGKTDSDRKLIEKVRADLGLPPEPKSRSMKEKYNKAGNAGLMVPLEGKSPAQKEEILQALADKGIPLPEGRTPSEKALIEKVKARTPAVVTPSEKLRKAKAAGLLTPLAGKTPEQKEKIIRGLAEQGVPLPEGKTASEKKLIDKVRADMGLPPEPKTPSMREKYNRAADAGLMVPLEGKSRPQKEKILQGLADMGIPLPEGRTSSEKSLIAKVKAKARPPSEGRSTLSKKLKKAKAAGLLTPLEGKSPEQKENIIKGLAMQGLPLPEPKTASEKKLVEKVRAELGLPPEPKSASDKEKYKKAIEAGIITPLEGKSPSQKERILRGQHEMGLPLPEGRTPSEKALIKEIKAGGVGAALPPEQRKKLDEKTAKNVKEGTGPVDECICGQLTPESEREAVLPGRITSGKLREAKAAGLLTPLEGKSPAQKEKILKGLAKRGLPLPEGKTASDKQLIDKVRNDLGLPPEPKTMSMKQKYAQAQDAGLITPLEGKSPSQKERILKGQAEMGLPLPEGRTASEKAIIAKIRATGPDITSEKLRKAKAAGLLTPLEGKSPEEKEKILKGLAKTGLPLPEGKTPSERALISKIKTAAGIPEETVSAKMRKAKAAGILTPLEGKTKSQKEKILRGRAAAGLPLPEGKTPSEKELVKKIKADTGYVTPTQSERMKRAKAAGLMTPLEGKTPSQKAQIIKGRIAVGLPPPEGKTPSEKEMIRQIVAGAPPERKTPSAKMRQAKAAGLLTPLEGKTPEQKENILRGLAKVGVPLPEPKTASEKDLINKIRQETGLPPEPKTPSLREKYKKAQAAGIITPLEGKTPSQKERVLKKMHDAGIPLPEGRTASEKALVQRVKAGLVPSEGRIPSEKLRAAKAAGLLTPLEGKTPEQKEKILKGLAKAGIPLPVAKTASEKALVKKVRNELGLPPEPQTASIKERMKKAQAAGLITPLEGKSPSQKERILRNFAEAGVPLPEGRTPSEKAMISKVQAEARRPSQIRGPPALPPEQARKLDEKTAKVMKEGKGPADECICGLLTPESKRPTEKISGKALSEKLRKAKAAGLLTPLKGKSPEEKERILKGLAQQGLPLPEPQTVSEKKLAEKVRKELGLPPEPDTVSDRKLYEKAVAAGKMVPLEGKTPSEKVKILKSLAAMGVPLPEGRTPSEKALIDKVRAEAKPIRIPSEKLRQAKAAGLLTPLEGKTPEQKEKIMRGLAMQGLPIPEPKTESDRKLAEKVRADLGLPPQPSTPSERRRYEKAVAAGKMVPLEGKTSSEKVKILKSLAAMGVPLPEGRTPSEKALVAKVRLATKPIKIPSEKLRQAKAAGLLTPLEGKTPEQKEKIMRGLAIQGLPIPEPKTESDRKLAEKVRAELGLPPEPTTPAERRRYEEAVAAGKMVPLEGKTPSEKVKILKSLAAMGVPLPEGRTPSEKALVAKVRLATKPIKIPSEKLRQAKAAGLLTPLEGKTPEQKEKIMRGLAIQGLPIPEPKTESDRKLAEKVRAELGLPPEPTTPAERRRYEEAVAAGKMVPLEGKTPSEKVKILKSLAAMGVPLPEGRTPSEKALVAKVRLATKPIKIPSEKLRQAKAAGLLTPLEGKTPEQKEKIMRGLAIQGLPIPEPKTESDRKLAEKVRAELGLPPEPTTPAERRRYEEAVAAGKMVPLEGKTPSEKVKILKSLAAMGVPLPEGRTSSEKALISKLRAEGVGVRGAGAPPLPPEKARKLDEKTAKVMKEGKGPADECICDLLIPESERVSTATMKPVKLPSEKLRKAKAAGLLTPLEGKTAERKEEIMRGLAMQGLPIPEPRTASERKLAEKVRAELGLPPEPKTPSERRRYEEGVAAGKIVPLEGKTASEKVKILKNQAAMGLPLPEGRTASEKSLIAKVRAETKVKIPSEKLRKAKAAGLLTPLEGKTVAQQEKILKGLALAGLPLPEPKTESERKSIEKVRTELGLPPEPKTPEERRKYEEGVAAGIIAPLEGKSAAEKATILRAQAEAGIPLPEGRTKSEKALIAQIKSESKKASKVRIPSEKIRKAKAAGLLTPLEGKSEAQKEKILRGLAMQGLPLPEGQTASERKLIDKVRRDLGLPPEPKTASEKKRYEKAIASGVIVPLENLSSSMKEKTLRAQVELGLPLPEGRTASEKALIAKVIAESKSPHKVSSEKLRKAKAAGLMTPLEGKSAAQKEKIIRGLAEAGMPLPEGKTPSEKSMLHKIRTELGIPPPARTASERELIREAKAEGLFTPLAGKSKAQKEKIIRGLAEAGLPIPEGKTASEKALITKIRLASGLPPEATPSEKRGGLKTKSKRIGVRALKSTKGIGARRTKVEGISEEFEDIVKTTTCDRGCGCDRKKIRFKHSYVKIKVTSPDISSLCPCPDECIPGVKGGIFTDNEGIKVTIGRAIGVPWYYRQLSLNNSSSEELVFDMGPDYKPTDSSTFAYNSNTKYTKNNNTKIPNKLCEDRVSSDESFGTKPIKDRSQNSISYLYNSMLQSNYNYWMDESDMFLGALCSDALAGRRQESLSASSSDCTKACSECSFDTLVIIKSETSLRLTTSSCSSLRMSSFLSFVDNEFTSNASQYLCNPLAESSSSNTAVHESDYFADIDRKTREEYLFKHRLNTDTKLVSLNQNQNRYEILRMTQSKFRRDDAMGNIEPVILINDVDSDHDIMTMMDELLSSREFSGASSIYVVISGSDSSGSETKDSAICLHTPEKKLKLSSSIHLKQRKSSIACALKISTTAKSKYYESYASPQYCKPDINRLLETAQNIKPEVKQPQEPIQTKQIVNKPIETLQTIKPDNFLHTNQPLQPLEKNTTSQPKHTSQKKDLLSRLYQIVPKKKKQVKPNIVSTDTTQDRPCCCSTKEREVMHVLPKYSKNIQCVASAVSELITPMIMEQGISQGIPMQDLGLPTQTSFSRHNFLSDSPVIMCEIPPCVGSECHDDGRNQQLATSAPCPPGQVKFAPTLNSGQQRSVGCGGSDTKPGINPTKKNAICPPCKNQESKTDKNSKGNKKKVKLKPPCASDPHHPPLSRAKPAAKVATRSVGCQCCRCADAQTGTEQPITEVKLCPEAKIDIKNEKCFCKNKPGKRNKVVCECPEVETEIDYIAYADYEIDTKDKWKMQSELTQTTSGFKVDLKKREVGSEMSFEDALAYYASLEMDTGADLQRDENCQCEEDSKKKKKKKSVECLCPEELPSVHEPTPAEPFKGFKLTIGGKGSASKGLSGVCCFDMYESNTYMVAYLDDKKTISRSSLSS